MGRWQTDLFRSPSFDGYQRVNGSVISIVSCFIFAFAPIGVKPQPKFPLLPAMPRCAPPSSCRRCSRWFQRPKAESGRRRSEARGQKSAVGGQKPLSKTTDGIQRQDAKAQRRLGEAAGIISRGEAISTERGGLSRSTPDCQPRSARSRAFPPLRLCFAPLR